MSEDVQQGIIADKNVVVGVKTKEELTQGDGRTGKPMKLNCKPRRELRGKRACSKKMGQRFLLTTKTVRNDVHTKPQKTICRRENAMKRQPSGVLDETGKLPEVEVLPDGWPGNQKTEALEFLDAAMWNNLQLREKTVGFA